MEEREILRLGGVKYWQAPVKFYIHLHIEVESLCNREGSHIADLAVIVKRETFGMKKNKLFKIEWENPGCLAALANGRGY